MTDSKRSTRLSSRYTTKRWPSGRLSPRLPSRYIAQAASSNDAPGGQIVTLAFKRTFYEGVWQGMTIDLTRQAGPAEATRLISEGCAPAHDGDGARAIDTFFRIADYTVQRGFPAPWLFRDGTTF